MSFKIASRIFILVILIGCDAQLKEHSFPNPVDTHTKEISIQEKASYRVNPSLFIDNKFDGARFNDLEVLDDSTISITTKPENEPINSSPWYAFRIISTKENTIQNLTITIDYPENHKHRYWPKISLDGENWTRLDSTDFRLSSDTLSIAIKLPLTVDTTWVAAQPLITSSDVHAWCDALSEDDRVSSTIIGHSIHQRPIPSLKIGTGSKTIIIFSRQHPPEVTGFKALQFFLEELLTNDGSQDFLSEFSLLVYPILNPDGVDMGHWRHNAGGVDLNRDWAYYRQPEIKAVANHIINTINEDKLEVELGLDFHSTWYDIYYTTDRSLQTKNHSFTDDWFEYIESKLEGYEVNDAPSGLQSPVSKGWFISQFNVPGITYEIGDDTSDDFNKKKSAIAAEGLMEVLMR